MFDRTVSRIVAIAAASGAAVMAVFAAGFSLYALIVPQVGPAGASAIVALIAALIVALIALFATFRARKREREAQAAGHDLAHALPVGLLGDVVRDQLGERGRAAGAETFSEDTHMDRYLALTGQLVAQHA